MDWWPDDCGDNDHDLGDYYDWRCELESAVRAQLDATLAWPERPATMPLFEYLEYVYNVDPFRLRPVDERDIEAVDAALDAAHTLNTPDDPETYWRVATAVEERRKAENAVLGLLRNLAANRSRATRRRLGDEGAATVQKVTVKGLHTLRSCVAFAAFPPGKEELRIIKLHTLRSCVAFAAPDDEHPSENAAGWTWLLAELTAAADAARAAGDAALADALDALAWRLAVVAEMASDQHRDDADALHFVHTLAPPGRPPTAVPILTNAPPALGVSVLAA